MGNLEWGIWIAHLDTSHPTIFFFVPAVLATPVACLAAALGFPMVGNEER